MSSDYLDYMREMMRMQGSGVCEEFPVIRRPWGGPNSTTLMIELWPDMFKCGKVIAAIEKGYVSTDDYAPAEWVENCCSGLVYERHAEGDNAKTCFIELVDFNDTYSQGKGAAAETKKTRRSRRGKKAAAPAAEAPVAEAPAAE